MSIYFLLTSHVHVPQARAKAGTEREVEVGRGDAVCALLRDPDMPLIFRAGEQSGEPAIPPPLVNKRAMAL